MDIERQLREMLVLRDPGTPFTDGVMARVAQVPAGQGSGVVRLAEARARKRGRRILFGALVVVGAAAAVPAYFRYRGGNAPQIQQAVALLPSSVVALQTDAGLQAQATGQGEPLAPAMAAEDCLDPDVLHGLLLPGVGEGFRITAEPPPELADFKVPRQLAWVGASERGVGAMGQSSLSAVYRSRLAPPAAQAAAADALAMAGWILQDIGRIASANVFTTDSFQQGDTYCRDQQSLTLWASALDGVTYVVLATMRQAGAGARLSNACEASPRRSVRSASTLDAYLPALELPRDPATGRPVAFQGMGGGGGGEAQRRMNVSFTLQDSADSVARHFARQMAAQGWSVAANWSGTGTAGSTWLRQADADSGLRATLAVAQFEGGHFTVVFHVVRSK